MRDRASNEAWTYTDGWVLSALALTDAGDGASFVELVAAADAINHAILTETAVDPFDAAVSAPDTVAELRRWFTSLG